MDPRAADLVQRFAEKMDGRTLKLLDVSPERGDVFITREGVPERLHLPQRSLLALLKQEQAEPSWGPGVSTEEGAARYIVEHYFESVMTNRPSRSRWWTYRHSYFVPVSGARVLVERLLRR